MRAASVIGEDVMSGRASSWQAMVSVENFHRSAGAPPASRGHAGHIRTNHDTAGHRPTSRLRRVPDGVLLLIPLPCVLLNARAARPSNVMDR